MACPSYTNSSYGQALVVTSATRPTGLELYQGRIIYEADTHRLLVYSGAAWSTVGPVDGPLLSWTPTVTQLGAVANTVNHGSYSRVGRQITASCNLTMAGSGTAANLVTLTLPVAGLAGSDGAIIGVSAYTRAATYYNMFATQANTGSVVYFTASGITAAAAESTWRLGSGSNFLTNALVSGEKISCTLQYEAAADA